MLWTYETCWFFTTKVAKLLLIPENFIINLLFSKTKTCRALWFSKGIFVEVSHSFCRPQTIDYVGLIKEDLEDLGTDQCVFNRDGSIVPIRAPTDTPTITMEDSEDTDQSLLRPFTCTSSHLMSQPSSSSSPKYHIPIKQTPSIRPFNESSEKKRKRNSGKSGNTREKLKKVCEHDQKQQFGKNDYMISSSSSSVGGGTENSCVSTRKSRKKYYTGRSPMYDSSYNNNNNHYSSTGKSWVCIAL